LNCEISPQAVKGGKAENLKKKTPKVEMFRRSVLDREKLSKNFIELDQSSAMVMNLDHQSFAMTNNNSQFL